MSFKTLTLAIEAQLAIITLNRPDKRNAISAQMIGDLLGALDQCDRNMTIRVVVLTGAGRAFCAGMDLEGLQSLAAQSQPQNLEDSRRTARLFRRLYDFPKPLIAAVNGAAIAGGTGIATMCDFTLAVPEAKFGYTEVRIGFIPALVSVFLRRQIGEKRARDLLLTGRIFEAAEAQQLGLVSEIVAPEKLLDRARELAATLFANSPTSLTRSKALLADSARAELDREIELAIAANAAIRSTADFREGLASFLEKRPPSWKGE